MPEITALIRVSLARHRWLLLAMLASIVVGVCVAMISVSWSPGLTGDRVAVFALFLSLMPAGIASIVLFDYGLDQDLSLPDSGCSHWILRMPIRAWKIAMVPVVLKSLWVSALWILFVLAARQMGNNEIPLIMPCVVFSAIAIWIMVISWRPFRNSLTRFASLVIAGPVLYIALLGAIAAPTIPQTEWRSLATAASVVAGLALYVGGAWCLIASTGLARTSPGGIISAAGSGRFDQSTGSQASRADEELPIRQYRSPAHALFEHDYHKSREWIRRLYALMVLPTILIFTLFVSVNAASVVVMLILFAYYSGFAGSRSFASPETANVLPVYLATSPLSTKFLAWSRQLFPFTAALVTYLIVLVVIAGWACWESNREIWVRWAEAQATAIGGDVSPVAVGLRLSTAIVLGVGVLLLGRLAAFAWVGMTGRSWVSMAIVIIASLALLIPFGLVLRWFLRQTDWESTRASAMQSLAMLPWLAAGLLVVKAVLAFIVSYASLKQQLVSVSDLVRVIAAWTALTAALGVVFYLLVPYSYASLTWCLAITALAIPLARILALPLALSWDRHR